MASRGVNKVILVGNLGQDPDCRTFNNGDMVANFSVATSETWQDRNTGENRERTEWHRCVAYRGLAGVIQQYLRKGSKVYIEGRLQTRSWQDNNGQTRYQTEVIVDQMQMLDSRSGGSADWDRNQQGVGYLDNRNNGSNNNYGDSRNTGYPNNSNGNNYNSGYSNNNGNNYNGSTQPSQPVPPKSQGVPIPGPDPDSGFEDDSIPF